jgi:hypothetical protein
MVDDGLAKGRGAAPFDLRLLARDARFVVTPEAAIGRAEAQAFKSWLIQEARAHQETPGANETRARGKGSK